MTLVGCWEQVEKTVFILRIGISGLQPSSIAPFHSQIDACQYAALGPPFSYAPDALPEHVFPDSVPRLHPD